MNDFEVFKSYVDEVNYHIAATSYTADVLYAEVYLAFNGTTGDEEPKSKGYPSFDGVRSNNTGHRIIAGELRKLGYLEIDLAALAPVDGC
jgi:hypothetical protein